MNARKTASQRSIAELSEVVCIHSLSDSYESEESQGKIDLTLFAVKWNSESTIFITLAHGWIFPFDLIATPQTPPLSGGSTRSDFERLLDLRNLWSALTFLFIYLFFVHYPVGWVFCQWRKHPSKCTKINFFFFFPPRIQELGSTGACRAWWIKWRVCAPSDATRLLRTLSSSCSSCVSIVLSCADAIKHNKCVPLLHFLRGFHPCLPFI